MRLSIAKATAFGIVLSAAFTTHIASNCRLPAYAGTTDTSVRKEIQGMPVKSAHEQIGKTTFVVSKTVVKAPPEKVFHVLTDYQNAPRIFSNLTSCKVLKEEPGRKIVKFGAKVAGNLWKFDYVLALTEKSPQRIEWKRVSGAFKANEGFWQLDPIEGGKATAVTYAKHIDGGLFFPKALVLKTIESTVPTIFAELTSVAE